jgi:hypothetical protein
MVERARVQRERERERELAMCKGRKEGMKETQMLE